MTTDTVRPGDFHGLVNVRKLEVVSRTVEAGAFTGLDGVVEMDLTVYTDGYIAPGAFQGLNNLEAMTIRTSTPYPDHEYTLIPPDFDPMENLKHLEVEKIPTTSAGTISGKLLANLSSLETVELTFEEWEKRWDEETMIQLPEELLASNKMLKTAVIKTGERTTTVPDSIFANNPLLEEIEIHGRAELEESTFQYLENLESLRIEDRRGEKHELILSEESPLYNKIKYDNESAKGYKAVNIED